MASVIKPSAEKKSRRDEKRNTSSTQNEQKLNPRRSADGTPEPRQRMHPEGSPWAVNSISATWLIILHLGALAAPFFFSWEGLALAVFFHWLTGSIGICLGYHRLLTHTGFKTYAPVKWLCTIIGGWAGEGPATCWVAHHRQHHAYSDQEGDPHSPLDGAWWSHMLWLGWTRPNKEHAEHLKRWAPDLQRDKVLQFIDMMFLPSHFLLGAAMLAAGWAYADWRMGVSFLIWGMFVRLVAVLHTTWFVNSASHIWGYRNYETTDQSRNNWWVALIGYGEGWHNNHHAYPRMAVHGHKWWEYDMTYAAIRVLKLTGLAWDVVDYKTKAESH